MSQTSLIQLTIHCLRQQVQALTPREIARSLLNERSVSGITLDALTERVQVDLEMERHTRGEASRFTRQGDRYAVLDLLELNHQESHEILDVSPDATRGSDRERRGQTHDKNRGSSLEPIETQDMFGHVTSLPTTILKPSPPTDQSQQLELVIRDYPLAHQVSSLLSLTHGERYTLVDSLRRALRRFNRAPILEVLVW